MIRINERTGRLLLACLLSSAMTLSAADNPATVAQAPQPSEIEQLKQMLADQQRQINELRQALTQQQELTQQLQKKETDNSVSASAGSAEIPQVDPTAVSTYRNLGQVASTTAVLPAGQVAGIAPLTSTLGVVPQAPAAAPAGPIVADLSKRLDGILRNLGGFRFSGDFRYRFDLQDRSANSTAAALQNARSRYRARLNIDKDLLYSDTADRSLAHIHFQISTGPFNNPLTNDTDFSGFGTKAPFSLAEAYADFMPTKALTLRIGRTAEIFADNRQFIWDDDLRLNGFHETYRFAGKKGFFAEFRAGQYILTNPNVLVVPPSTPTAVSPYVTAGYAVGQRVPSSDLFDQGVVLGSNLGNKWRVDFQAGYSTIREPNQIQLASTAGGLGLVTNAILGSTLSSNLGATGNATTTSGGAIYSAGGFDVIHYGGNLYYAGKPWRGHGMPFVLFLQGTHNKAASSQNNGYMLGASIGQAAKLGDVQLQYAYFYKPANAFVSQFTDDDVGTGSGVNIKDNTLRVNFGITRWLAWENRLFLQKGISRNGPNFFLPLQQGYNTTIRFQSHLAFTF
jgi:hypothetical protein